MKKLIVLALLVAAGYGWWAGWFRPKLPVTIRMRESKVAQGLVAVFRNGSDRSLQVRATFENAVHGRTRTQGLALTPQEDVEFGWLEGWKFASGETILVEHADFRPLRFEVP